MLPPIQDKFESWIGAIQAEQIIQVAQTETKEVEVEDQTIMVIEEEEAEVEVVA
jgi:hypothetical protein